MRSSNEYWLAPQGAVAEEKAWAQFRAWKAVAKPVHVAVTATTTVAHAAAVVAASSGVAVGSSGGGGGGGAMVTNITLRAPAGGSAALAIRLQLGHAAADSSSRGNSAEASGGGDSRVLPAWFSANYITLLPGARRVSDR